MYQKNKTENSKNCFSKVGTPISLSNCANILKLQKAHRIKLHAHGMLLVLCFGIWCDEFSTLEYAHICAWPGLNG